MSSASHKSSPSKASLSRSSSVSKEPDLDNVEEESDDQVFNDTITSDIGNTKDETMTERQMDTPYNRREFSRRQILNAKLKYHFMNPWQKYKARKRKPWKLLIQILKIIIVTVQVELLFLQDVMNSSKQISDSRALVPRFNPFKLTLYKA
jgi:hypothetical protein